MAKRMKRMKSERQSTPDIVERSRRGAESSSLRQEVRGYWPFSYSTLLFAQPSFLSGMASVLDVGGVYTEFNQSLTPEQADMLALAADRRAVFRDFKVAATRLAHNGSPRVA